MGLCKVSNVSTRAIAEVLSKKRTLFAILLIAVYAVINGILLYFHEPWRDEAQAWLIARDLTFWEIPSQMSYEGHPCLWHWILYPFAHMGLPYITINIVSYVIMLAATAFMVWKAPFPIWVKVLFALSPCLTYFYPVIARSYCLIPPILFALAYLYPTRKEHPCRYTIFIALLVQTHVIMEMMALMLSLLLLIEYARDIYITRNRRKALHYILALLIPLISAIFLLYQLYDVETSSSYEIKQIGIREIIVFLSHYKWFICTTAMLVVMAVLKRANTAYAAVAITVVSLCFQVWFYIAVYAISCQRYMAAIHILIWAFWIIQDSRNGWQIERILSRKYAVWANRLCNIILVLFFATLIKKELPVAYRDIRLPYSNAKEAAKFIKTNIPKDAILLADAPAWASAITPYLDDNVKPLFCSTMKEFSFVTWDGNEEATISYEDFKREMDVYGISNVPIYLISVTRWSFIRDSRLSEDNELIYNSKVKAMTDEDFDIYKIH